jgi:hypothetical protein
MPERIHPGDSGYLAAVEVVAEQAQERIAAVLADCARIERESAADEGTHDTDCWLAHNACWAVRIRRTLTGEDTTDAH